MSYKKALYYPYIDIEDEGWLKNAILYWDEISTIVPESVQYPYNTITGQELQENGVLTPLYVDNIVENAENELKGNIDHYFNTPQGQEILNCKNKPQYQEYIYSNKFPPKVLKRLMDGLTINNENIIDLYKEEKNHSILKIDSRFFNFYMTLLASTISKSSNIELLTDNPLSNNLSNNVKLDSLRDNPKESKKLAEGMLINITFDNLNINPDTPLDKVMDFKDDHLLELTKFKKEILEITSSNYSSINEIVYDYTSEVKPRLDSLKNSLKDNKIKFTIGGIVSYMTIFPCINLIPDDHISLPLKTTVSAGITILAYALLWNIEKKNMLKNNPYSYLFSVEKYFKKA